MFGGLDTNGLPRIECYADALRRWERTPKIRGHAYCAPRPLGRRSQRTKWLVRHGDEAFSCRLHNTDVMTFHKDGRLVVNPWESKTTNDFFNAIVPGAVHAAFTCPLGAMLWVGSWRSPDLRGYLIGTTITVHRVDGAWVLHPDSVPPRPIENYNAEQKQMRAAAKASGFSDFLAWVKASAAMGRVQVFDYSYYRQLDDRTVQEMLGDPAQWEELFRLAGPTHTEALTRIRTSVYRAYGGCVRVESLPHLTDHKQVTAIRGRQIAYTTLV